VTLDNTGIHPERYAAVKDMAQELGVAVTDLIGTGAKKILDIRTKWAGIIGEYTFEDIVKELEKPGRDPRDPFKVFQFKEDIFEVKDLKEDMICPGIVTNVTNFGAFVDVGVHQDGLVHISEMSQQFVEDPRKVVNPGDHVMVRVLAVDLAKNQISFSMILDPNAQKPKSAEGTFRGARGEGDRQQRERAPAANQARSAQGNNGRPTQGKPFSQGKPAQGKPIQGGGHGGKGRDEGARRPGAAPFNNPFAALQGFTNKK
jgi:uncharacterized protein